jgi:hypothetical protein
LAHIGKGIYDIRRDENIRLGNNNINNEGNNNELGGMLNNQAANQGGFLVNNQPNIQPNYNGLNVETIGAGYTVPFLIT